MEDLFTKLEKYTIKDAIYFEEKDRQFLALKKLYENKKMNDANYLFIIIINSLICYQLSGKGENYWEEFSDILVKKDFNNFFEIYSFFKKFIPESKNNRRFVDTKLKRVSKLDYFYKEFLEKIEFYNNNMEILLENLSKIMNQKLDAKTIVFAIKMFSYGSRNIFGFKKISEKIHIPVDSRLEKLYYRYNHTSDKEIVTNKIIKEFYSKLSEKLSIPELHLDAILWVNYDEFIK